MQSCANRNSFYAYSENSLLSMLVDDHQEIRGKAVNKILEICENNNSNELRIFKKPELNFNAKYYFELIDFNDEVMYPPVTKLLSTNDLLECIDFKVNVVSEIIKGIPLHSQSVERLIKIVSEASEQGFGEETRNGIIYSKLTLKELLGKSETKSDYNEFMTKELFRVIYIHFYWISKC